MHPAKSVIFFTTASGAGYGLLALIIAANIGGLFLNDFWLAFTGYALSYVLITAGLLSSTFHLGHPERAWRALTQWRSSWLSREGVMAIFTFLPTGLYGLHHLFFPYLLPGVMALVGLIGILACIVTVYCTAMIYASLKPVHAWANRYVPMGYLLLSLMSGSVLLNGLLAVFGYAATVVILLAVVALVAALVWKIAYWRFLDGTRSISTAESATGLGEFGRVHLFEAPHTEANYLMKEMGFQIARKHAAVLRKIALGAGFILPILLILLGLTLGGAGLIVAASLAVIIMAIGIVTERWLFFAEARHTVGLYYGASHA
ncbi:DmsC/YnfH family molybdoenzyme membrane anchor subunit [uncultured Sneathiella sp.]|jgi:DMSO reductase anchor subunit|uniref:dimethyl sulfoxide reductase anchor subunit family protein n=1 Tax=uncultured Sneathiella sp. TaxID=879315 RepID=UPI0030DA43A3|tara:strand:- start:5465 stop:6415 length:951 start_codon:yes stop_codon:yes gene_type:complete